MNTKPSCPQQFSDDPVHLAGHDNPLSRQVGSAKTLRRPSTGTNKILFLKRRIRLAISCTVVAIFTTIGTMPLFARPITSEEAVVAVNCWLNGQGQIFDKKIDSSPSIASVQTKTDEEGTPLFHIVGTDSGAVVITSAESGVEPIVAVTFPGEEAIDPAGPLMDILSGDMALRIENVLHARAREASGKKDAANDGIYGAIAKAESKWDELLDDGTPSKYGLSSISDVRVAALVQSKWGQGNVGSTWCYNYYTPNHYVCGCVATAAAQVMKYWAYPTASVPSITRVCQVNGSNTSRSSNGGTFAWSSMPLVPSSSMTATQRQAIGHLCYDVGVAVSMNWTSDESGASGYMLPDALTGVFGYASAMCRTHPSYGGSTAAFTQTEIKNSIWAGLDAGCPAIIGIYGHEVVADGYGFQSGTAYTHLNMGWSGDDDVWYNLPTVSAGGYYSSALDEVVYNIHKSRTGDLLTGRVLNSSGSPVSGATVTATYNSSVVASATTGAKGIYALWLTGGRTYSVTATSGSQTATKSVYVTKSISESIDSDFGAGTIGNSWGNDLTLQGSSGGGSLSDAVDNYAMTFTTGGNASWYYQQSDSHDNIDSARSGSIGNGQETWMQATGVSGSGIISFWWKVSSETGYDWIEFYIDGEFKFGWSGTGSDWRYEAFKVGTGSHTFKWVYSKDVSYYSGSDCAWVDQVKFTANSPLSPVYRFYSRKYKGHFFTMNEGEMSDLIENNDNWNYEGVAYFAYPNSIDGTTPLYRFYSKKYSGHFYTRDYSEYWSVRTTNPNWKYEGEAYYIRSSSGRGSTPIYRFWSKAYRHHFYTASYDEFWTLYTTNPNWTYEGIAFYAWATPEALASAALNSPKSSSVEEGGDLSGSFILDDAGMTSANQDLSYFDDATRDGADRETGHGTFAERDVFGYGDAFSLTSLAVKPSLESPDNSEKIWLPDLGFDFEEEMPVAVPGETEIGGILVETCTESPTWDELTEEPNDSGVEPLFLRLALPSGEWNATLWSAVDGALFDEPVEGVLDFAMPTDGAWHLLQVSMSEDGEDGDDVFSLWLRAE